MVTFGVKLTMNWNHCIVESNITFQMLIVVLKFLNEKGILSHTVDLTTLEHFDGVKMPTTLNEKYVRILIEQPNNSLLTGLAEREGKNLHQSNFVLTRHGPVASSGRVPCISDSFSSQKVSIEHAKIKWEVGKIKQEIAELKQKLLQGVRNSQLVLLNHKLPLLMAHTRFIDNRRDGAVVRATTL